MANPNMANATQIYGNNTATLVSLFGNTLVDNPAASGKVFKINNVIVTNTSTTTAAAISISLTRTGINSGYIVYNKTVPANSALVIVDSTTDIYIKENQYLSAISVPGTNSLVVSWEEIS